MADARITQSQNKFMLAGGIFEMPLAELREKGILPSEYLYQEYPKHVEVNGQTVTVNSEDEEDRVLSGGKTSAQVEDERQVLILRARNAGLRVDPSWSVVRLRRELGEALDEAPAPGDTVAKLEAELAGLKKMAAMQAEIEALRAQLSKPADDLDAMRAELTALGVRVDGRWSAARLREELERATEPT